MFRASFDISKLLEQKPREIPQPSIRYMPRLLQHRATNTELASRIWDTESRKIDCVDIEMLLSSGQLPKTLSLRSIHTDLHLRCNHLSDPPKFSSPQHTIPKSFPPKYQPLLSFSLITHTVISDQAHRDPVS